MPVVRTAVSSLSTVWLWAGMLLTRELAGRLSSQANIASNSRSQLTATERAPAGRVAEVAGDAVLPVRERRTVRTGGRFAGMGLISVISGGSLESERFIPAKIHT
jgi:hypothetical protein